MMLVTCEIQNAIALLTLDNPPVNVLSRALVEQLNACLLAVDNDDRVRVIVIKGKGRAFCAGADLNELQAMQIDDPDDIEKWQYLSTLKKPVIACVTGACCGGGFEIALMCDMIYASQNAVFSFPEVRLGLLPGGGGTLRIQNQLNASRAMSLLLMGDRLSAETAYQWGIVNGVYDTADLCENEVYLKAKTIATLPANAVCAIKKLLQQSNCVEKKALQNERQMFFDLLFCTGGKDGISAFINKT